MATFNAEYLKEEGSRRSRDPRTGGIVYRDGHLVKNLDQVKHITLTLSEIDADLIILQEVENLAALQLLNRKHLASLGYRELLVKGNTEGMHIGFLIKRDLPFMIEFYTNRDISWDGLSRGPRHGPHVLPRDLPLVVMHHVDPDSQMVLDADPIIVGGVHGKAEDDSEGDPGSEAYATAGANATLAILNQFMAIYPESPVVIGGDFNRHIPSSGVLAGLKRVFSDVFALAGVPEDQRITHTWFNPGEPAIRRQLDTFMTNAIAKNLVVTRSNGVQRRPRVVHWNAIVDGKLSDRKLPEPKSYEEWLNRFSDHQPVVFDLTYRYPEVESGPLTNP